MIFDIVTLFPGMFLGPFQESILGRARRDGKVAVRLHDLRRFGVGKHRLVDGTPYGGGGGMVLRPEPIFDAVDEIRRRWPAESEQVVLFSPQGRKLDHGVARTMAQLDRLILICGRYEGVDERVREGLADLEISVGDVVLTGGELPAMMLVDSVSRFLPGVLGCATAASNDSFADGDSFKEGYLEYPYYTRPAEYRGLTVPEVLQGGDHGAIAAWRDRKSREATRTKRPDLLGPGDFSPTGRD